MAYRLSKDYVNILKRILRRNSISACESERKAFFVTNLFSSLQFSAEYATENVFTWLLSYCYSISVNLYRAILLVVNSDKCS